LLQVATGVDQPLFDLLKAGLITGDLFLGGLFLFPDILRQLISFTFDLLGRVGDLCMICDIPLTPSVMGVPKTLHNGYWHKVEFVA
jgi:hypothetical protein